MSNAISDFFGKLSHLFCKAAPKVEHVLQPEIDLLTGLATKYAALDLTTATATVLASVVGGVPAGHAISAGAAALKAQAITQGMSIADNEASLIAQALTKHTIGAVNAAANCTDAAVGVTVPLGGTSVPAQSDEPLATPPVDLAAPAITE